MNNTQMIPVSVSRAARQRDYDLIILGGGSAGIVSGVMAGGLGLSVLVVENAKMGGECLNTGCVPSKALLHAARVAQTLRRDVAAFGFPVHDVTRAEASAALEWARKSVGAVQNADATESLLIEKGVTIRRGSARFADPHTLLFEDGRDRVTADSFLIATGSHPVVPADIPGLDETAFLTNQTLFDLTEIPERLLVLGGGPIGVEMAQAFGRLGSRVTLVQSAERLLPRDDAELVEKLTDCLRAENIDIRLQTKVERIESGGKAVLRAGGGGDSGPGESLAFDRLLVATGRAPNVNGLALHAAGVDFDAEGVRVDKYLRTSAPNIYACGDVIKGDYRFSHMAEYEAKIAVRNIVFPGSSAADYHAVPWATFTEPELAHVGLTEDEARKQGVACEVFSQPFAQNDRALTDAETAGLVKVLVAPGLTGKILGVHILGPRAGELLQEWVMAMENNLTIRAVADMVHVYPTLSMASQHAAQRWYERQARKPLVSGALNAYVTAIRPREKQIAAGVLAAAVGATIWGWVSGRRGKKTDHAR